MANFKIGDKVIAKFNHSGGSFRKGDEFIIDGFCCCPSCGLPCIQLRGRTENCISICDGSHKGCGCGFMVEERESFWIGAFEKPASFGELASYKVKVSIPELTEIKEIQNH